jgi:indole-3-glycerol phosphate synthase
MEHLTWEALEAQVPTDLDRRSVFCAALRAPGLSIIAEHKRRAPSSGSLAQRSLDETVAIYEQAGASAMSVLTEADHFDGHLDDLQIASGSKLPCIRKDFIIHRYMIAEAGLYGASAVLLLACVLTDEEIEDYCAYAHQLGLAVLLEAHNGEELARALKTEADAIGVNARDLKTFEIDLNTALKVLGDIPSKYIRVAESGVHSPEDALRCLQAGADAALVGTALMRAEDPLSLLATLTNISGATK